MAEPLRATDRDGKHPGPVNPRGPLRFRKVTEVRRLEPARPDKIEGDKMRWWFGRSADRLKHRGPG